MSAADEPATPSPPTSTFVSSLLVSAHLDVMSVPLLFVMIEVASVQAGGAAGTAVDMSLFPLDTIKTR